MQRHEHAPACALETLEGRRLLAADFRSIDGTGNNLAHPEWGSTGTQFLRQGPAAYGDKVSSPAGSNRPSARAISNAVAAALPEGQFNNRNMSGFLFAWGQFIDHDLDLTVSGSPAEAFDVKVPKDDLLFDPTSSGNKTIPLTRSLYDPKTGTSAANPRQQVNNITTWIDGSMVYGSDTARAAELRTLVGGKLKTGVGDLLPLDAKGAFMAGDIRVNENTQLMAMQTLFVREHNRIAAELAAGNSKLTDEQIYQRARNVVIAEIQAITYNEFLPALMGGAVDRYRGYNPRVNPAISNEFSTAAFRLGHSMLDDSVGFVGNDGKPVGAEISLAQAFFNPGPLLQYGLGPVLKHLASDRTQEIDNQIVDGVRNFLFGPPGAGGLDLASLNIQRGRDHGIGDYNSTRKAYGLKKVTSFSQITSDPVLAGKLQQLYGSVDNVDLWVGGLAEDHLRGSSLGPTFSAIVADQFERVRDGDRFWYEWAFSGRELRGLQNTHLSDIISRNTEINNLQENVFVFDVSVNGLVFFDRDSDGRQDFFERGMPGLTVQILDAEGDVVGSGKTNRLGRYSVSGLNLGEYTLRVQTPGGGWEQTTVDPSLEITRGITLSNVNVGYARADAGGNIVAADWTGFTDDAAEAEEDVLLTTI